MPCDAKTRSQKKTCVSRRRFARFFFASGVCDGAWFVKFKFYEAFLNKNVRFVCSVWTGDHVFE